MRLGPLAILGAVVFTLIQLYSFSHRAPKIYRSAEEYLVARQAQVGAKGSSAVAAAKVNGSDAEWYSFDKTGPSDKSSQFAVDLLVTRDAKTFESLGGKPPAGYTGPPTEDLKKLTGDVNATIIELPPPGSEISSIVVLGFLSVFGVVFAAWGRLGVALTRLLSLVAGVSACFLIDAIAHQQNDYGQRLIVLAGLYVTLAVSLNLINGITGQFSIGHAAFYQIGAYLSGFITLSYFKGANVPPLLWLVVMMFVGAVGAGFAGFVVGLPSLRLRGDYLAIVTMGFGEIIRIEIQNTPALGGAYGLNVAPKIQTVWMIWLLAIVCIAVSRNLIKTAHGLPFLAVREDEVASAAMGVNVTRIKVTAFIIGSMFAGAAGALLSHYEGFITGATFSMDISFIILTMVVLGGTGSITGSAVAAAFLSYLPERLRGLKNPDGSTLTVTAASIAAGLIAVVIAVAVIKRVMDHGSQSKPVKAALYVGTIVVAVVAKLLTQVILSKVPALMNISVEAGQLRMVIFAVTLIVLMLLRPQGIFGHHEFSWTWVDRILGGKRKSEEPAPAVAA